MRSTFLKWAPSLGAIALAIAITPQSQAQCGLPLKAKKPVNWFVGGAGAHLRSVELSRAAADDTTLTPIVGMWHVLFAAKTMSGNPIPDTVIDNALVVWHSDKTEIMNSGRPAQDGNFCLGVWEQTGDQTFQLNHFAWSANDYAPGTPDGIVGPRIGGVHYTENVTVAADGNHYSGTFTLQEYDTSARIMLSFTGNITGTRITVNTSVGDLL